MFCNTNYNVSAKGNKKKLQYQDGVNMLVYFTPSVAFSKNKKTNNIFKSKAILCKKLVTLRRKNKVCCSKPKKKLQKSKHAPPSDTQKYFLAFFSFCEF